MSFHVSISGHIDGTPKEVQEREALVDAEIVAMLPEIERRLKHLGLTQVWFNATHIDGHYLWQAEASADSPAHPATPQP